MPGESLSGTQLTIGSNLRLDKSVEEDSRGTRRFEKRILFDSRFRLGFLCPYFIDNLHSSEEPVKKHLELERSCKYITNVVIF